METSKSSNGLPMVYGNIDDLCRSLTVSSISTHDWMMQIISDKLALAGHNQSSGYSERSKHSKVFQSLNQFISFLMNQDGQQERIKILLSRKTERDYEVTEFVIEISSKSHLCGWTPLNFD